MMYGKLCTEFYDADKKFADKNEIDLYQSVFSQNDLILEPMCGSGRLLIPLLNAGLNVHGLDNSHEMLESCRRRAKQFSLSPHLLPVDIKDLDLNTKYDGIIIPFGSYQLFYPRIFAYEMLEKLIKLLKPNGRLVIDLFVPWETLYKGGEQSISIKEVTLESGDIIRIENQSSANKYEQYLLSKTNYTKIREGKVIQSEDEEMYVAWYYHYEFILMLEKYGINDIHYQERFLNNSNHMTFVARLT